MLSQYRPFCRISSVAGADVPAFVERGWTCTMVCAATTTHVSPGLMSRPSLSDMVVWSLQLAPTLVSPGLMSRPSLSEHRPRGDDAPPACRRG